MRSTVEESTQCGLVDNGGFQPSSGQSLTNEALEVELKSYGVLLTSCAGDGSCEASQPPPSASINPVLAVVC